MNQWVFLENSSPAVKKIRFGNGWKIKSYSVVEGYELLRQLEGTNTRGIEDRADLEDIQSHRFFVVEKKTRERISIINKEIYEYVKPRIRLASLYCGGNLAIGRAYTGVNKRAIGTISTLLYTEKDRFEPNKSEIRGINSFIQKAEIFSEEPLFLKRAAELFDLSYKIHDPDIQLTLSITGLESIFNIGTSEIGMTMGRGTAILLGKNKCDSKSIYYSVKELYNLRSKIVHGASKRKVTKDTAKRARNYLRRCVKKLLFKSIEKKDLNKKIISSGFGAKLKFN